MTARLVFTNGCFDLLHPGHVDFLRRASALGDWLLVGLNSDRSVRALKGPTRPIVPQRLRREMLLSLRWVNEVVIFDAPTPAELVRRRRPSIMVKGADWAARPIAGAEHAGSVVFLPLLSGWSTSELIARLRHCPL